MSALPERKSPFDLPGVAANEPEPPRRLTPSERAHELMLQMIGAVTAALTKRTTMQRESNTVTRNAKGDAQIEVVTYRQDDESEDDFNARTEARFDRLTEKYELSRAQNFGRDYTPPEQGKK